MTIDEAIKIYNGNAEYERTHGNLQGCLEFRQLAEWLRDYKRLKELKQLREQTQWIPVSERLPEKDKYTEFYECLVAVPYTSRHNVCKTVSAYFNGKHFYRNRFDRAFISEVKAWMPLPESYKGE